MAKLRFILRRLFIEALGRRFIDWHGGVRHQVNRVMRRQPWQPWQQWQPWRLAMPSDDAIRHAKTGTKRNSLRPIIEITEKAIKQSQGIGAIRASERL